MNLSIDQKLIVLYIALSLTLSAIYPDKLASALGLALSSALFGLTLYLNRFKESRLEAMEAKLKAMADQVQALTIHRATHR